MQAIWYTLVCMGLQREYLEYMGIVLENFPLMYCFIIVQIVITALALVYIQYHLVLSHFLKVNTLQRSMDHLV